eukprot:1788386-Rhodomonas_salina.1
MSAEAGESSAAGASSAASVVRTSAPSRKRPGRSSAAPAGMSEEAGESSAVSVVSTSSRPGRSSAAPAGISVWPCTTRATVVALPDPADVRSPPESVQVEPDAEGGSEELGAAGAENVTAAGSKKRRQRSKGGVGGGRKSRFGEHGEAPIL